MTQTWCLWAVAILHGGQTVVSAWHGQHAVALMMLGFTIADLGMLWVATK